MNDNVTFRESLRVPVRWWVQGTLLIGSFWLAMVVAVPEVLTWTVTALAQLLLVLLLHAYGSKRIVVTDTWLYAGRARIERKYLGSIALLDREQMRAAAGRDASARAYLLLRPYIATGVRVGVEDERDSTPYWLLSSRRAADLATALAATPSLDREQGAGT